MAENRKSSLRSMADNPFRRRRLVTGMSQKELALRAGVSSACVTDTEVGLYRKPPKNLLRALSDSEEGELTLELMYYTWVTEIRASNKVLFSEIPVQTFTHFINATGSSFRGFCRNLVVQRSLLQDYVKHERNWPYLSHCLYQVGLSEDYVTYLRSLDTK